MAEIVAGSAAVVQVNTDQSPRLSARFTVRGIPVLLLLQKGRVVHRLQGAHPAESVVAWYRSEAGRQKTLEK